MDIDFGLRKGPVELGHGGGVVVVAVGEEDILDGPLCLLQDLQNALRLVPRVDDGDFFLVL